MIIQPVADYLLIKPVSYEKQTSSGIELPEDIAQKYRPRRGRIIAVGEKVSSHFQPNRLVLFKVWGGNEVKDIENVDESTLLVLEEDVLAILVEEPHEEESILA